MNQFLLCVVWLNKLYIDYPKGEFFICNIAIFMPLFVWDEYLGFIEFHFPLVLIFLMITWRKCQDVLSKTD